MNGYETLLSNLLVVVVMMLLDHLGVDVWSHGKHIKTELTIVAQTLSPVRQSDILNCNLLVVNVVLLLLVLLLVVDKVMVDVGVEFSEEEGILIKKSC